MSGIKPKVSIGSNPKETILGRLHYLINNRPLRDIAEIWGIPRSTLNNYFYRGSTPKVEALKKIALVENVSFEWLISGNGEQPQQPQQPQQPTLSIDDALTNEISSLLRRASSKDKECLLSIICDIGIKGILSKLQQPDAQHEREYTTQELETMIMALPVRESLKTAFARGITAGEDADKEILRILESHQQGLSPEGSGNKTTTPAPPLKQKAG
ncbi:helix-turn-helix domain-containing protein [Salmonella enterica]|nr:helix-turn-helix domain-containing protein [Salmonella enterica]